MAYLLPGGAVFQDDDSGNGFLLPGGMVFQSVYVAPAVAAPQGGGVGRYWVEDDDRPRIKSTRERVRDIIEGLDEVAEEMLEAVSGEVIGTVAPRPVDVSAIADRMTPRLSVKRRDDDDDDDLLLLSF